MGEGRKGRMRADTERKGKKEKEMQLSWGEKNRIEISYEGKKVVWSSEEVFFFLPTNTFFFSLTSHKTLLQ